MADAGKPDGTDDGTSLEMPSFSLRRRKKAQQPAEPVRPAAATEPVRPAAPALPADAGSLLLRVFSVPDAGSTSVRSVGILALLVLVFLPGSIDES